MHPVHHSPFTTKTLDPKPMKQLLSLLFALTLTAGVVTSCASKEDKLAEAGCDCLRMEDKAEQGKCLDQMAVDEPKLKEDKEYGKKVREMMREKCPDEMEGM